MRNKKGFIAAGVVVLALAIAPLQLWASTGRLSALGLTNTTSWMLGLDEGYFFIDPAVLEQLRPQVWADVTAPQMAGILINASPRFDLYLVTGVPVSLASFGGAIPAVGITPLTRELLRVGAAFTAGKMDVGLSAFTGMTGYTAGTTNEQDLVAGLTGGVILPLSQGMSLDAAAMATYWSVQRHYSPAADYVATPIDVAARARLNITSQANAMHIYGQYNLQNRDYTLLGTLTKSVTNNATVGFSDEMTISPAVLIFAGAYANASFLSVAAGNTNTYTIAGNAGSELKLSNDATVRLGFQKTFAVITYSSAANSTGTADGPMSLSGGLGLNVGDLTFDANVNTALFVNGPNFISGGFSSPWTAALTATYYFGKAK